MLVLLVVLLGMNVRAADVISVPEFLDSISVTIDTPISSGSGVAFTRKDASGNDVTFIWTAGHIAHHYRPPDLFRVLLDPSATNAIVMNFTNLTIIQNVVTNGQFAYKTNLHATVIKCSPIYSGHDLAVLRVDSKFFNTNTVTFDLSGRIPKLGEPLYGLSSPFEEGGSFSTGIYSGIGRVYDGLLYDQTSLNVYPGSSGGGVFLPDGRCVGLNIIMRAPNMNFIVPIRRMQKWAKQENVEWALDPSIPMPSEKVMKALPRNDRIYRPTRTQPSEIESN